jgi:hypothetical protein
MAQQACTSCKYGVPGCTAMWRFLGGWGLQAQQLGAALWRPHRSTVDCCVWLPLLGSDMRLALPAGPMKFSRCRWHPNHDAVGCLYAVAQQGREKAYVVAYQVRAAAASHPAASCV